MEYFENVVFLVLLWKICFKMIFLPIEAIFEFRTWKVRDEKRLTSGKKRAIRKSKDLNETAS